MNESDHSDNTHTHVVLAKGTMVGHYRIISKIGAGGMGEVYLAEDTELDRKVALKFLPPHLCQDDDCRKRFKREAQAAAKLDHPNIVTIYEVSEHQARPYFAMQHVEGLSLREYAKAKKLELERIVDLAIQVCDGLNAAHDKGITHRDIKPSNIVIDAYGRPKLLDFGLATIQGGDPLTKTGSTLGTVRYMSPEQVQGREIDHRSDLFSLGVVLYELITGHSPFGRDNDMATGQAIVNDVPDPLAKYHSNVPEALQAIVSKLLEKEPDLRYQSAVGVISDLKRLISSTQSSIAVSPARPRRRWPAWAGLGVVAIAAVLVWQFFWPKERAALGEARKMLAVLPFENLGDPEDEYFADGITEEITARLATVRGLGIIARTSVLQYKGTNKPIPEIAEELGVDYILEGTVRWQKSPGSPDRVRVTPQLIKVSDATHAWAEVYDEVMAEVFEVQTDIAAQIVRALDITLLEPARKHLMQEPTDDVEAYDFYLQGNAYFSQGFLDRKSMQAAARMYQKAVERDSGFAVAWAKLSRAYLELYWHQERKQEELISSERAVKRALAIDPDLPEAHVSMGSSFYHAGAYAEALKEFNIALKSIPNSSDLLSEMAHTFWRQGLMDSAISVQKRAIELDPRSATKLSILGQIYCMIDRYSQALVCIDRAIALAPDQPQHYYNKAWIHVMESGDTETARRILDEASEMITSDPFYDHMIALVYFFAGQYQEALEGLMVEVASEPGANYYRRAMVYSVMGDEERARLCYDSALTVLEEIRSSHKDLPHFHSGLALTYAGLGRKEEAVRSAKVALKLAPVEKDVLWNPAVCMDVAGAYVMVGEYEPAMAIVEDLLSYPTVYSSAELAVSPMLAPIRDHPRFQALLEKYGDTGVR